MPPPPPPTDCASCWKWTWHRSFHDCCRFHRPPHLKDHPVDWKGFVGVFAIKLLLEVCGAAGAVWGCTEVVHWRTESNAVFFRNWAILTFFVFLVRFYWHAKHWLEHEHDFPYVKIHHRRQHMIHFLQVFAAKFLLQVMGGAGAIWGASDAVGFRTPETQESWRTAAIVVGNLFFVRWVSEILSYCLLCRQCAKIRKEKEDGSGENDEAAAMTRTDQGLRRLLLLNDWNEHVSVKFVLEVCGACGAVWGSSEVAGLHTEYNKDSVWRPIALTVGAIFALRWMRQTIKLVFLDQTAQLVTEPMTLQKRSSVHLAHSRLHVSASVRRLSQNLRTASTKAFGLEVSAQDLQDLADEASLDSIDYSENHQLHLQEGTSINTDKEQPISGKEIDVEQGGNAVTSSLRLMSTSETMESYKSCEE